MHGVTPTKTAILRKIHTTRNRMKYTKTPRTYCNTDELEQLENKATIKNGWGGQLKQNLKPPSFDLKQIMKTFINTNK
jgi:hypothetical protein